MDSALRAAWSRHQASTVTVPLECAQPMLIADCAGCPAPDRQLWARPSRHHHSTKPGPAKIQPSRGTAGDPQAAAKHSRHSSPKRLGSRVGAGKWVLAGALALAALTKVPQPRLCMLCTRCCAMLGTGSEGRACIALCFSRARVHSAPIQQMQQLGTD